MGLAPWCKNEVWETQHAWARVTGRQRCPEYLKDSYLWRFANDYEQQLSEAPWYMPKYPTWVREVCWRFRNPFQNANLFVYGVADRNYTVQVIEGDPNPMTVQRDTMPPGLGYQSFPASLLAPAMIAALARRRAARRCRSRS